ncbi:MAG: hypothetical protein JO222_03330, partial [Frankiales bacterium]|nr:hypothetical protein [Frankiales bacterium]
MAAAASRRLATLAGATAIAVVGGLAASIAPAGAADPISSQAPPTLTAPANNTTTAVKDVVLTWTAVTYATSYQVQLSPNSDFTNNVVGLPDSGKTINTTYQVPVSLPHDEYYWRVRAIDAGGHTGWSAARTFLHDWQSSMTLLKAPVSSDPSLAWTPVREASIYRVRYSTEADFPTVPSKTAVCWTHNTSFTPYTLQSSKENLTTNCMKATDLADGLHLFFDVTAYDDSSAPVMTSDNANDSAWDCPQPQPECDANRIFGAFDYAVPHAGTPAQGTVTGLTTSWHTTSLPGTDCTNGSCPTTPTFSWNAVAGANFYRVFIYRDP